MSMTEEEHHYHRMLQQQAQMQQQSPHRGLHQDYFGGYASQGIPKPKNPHKEAKKEVTLDLLLLLEE